MCSGRYVCSKCVDHAETSSLASPPQPPLQLPARVSRSIQKVPRSLQLQRESDVEGTPSKLTALVRYTVYMLKAYVFKGAGDAPYKYKVMMD